jgi:pilus assembly protein CpaB
MQRYGGFILLGLAVLMALCTSALLYNWLEQQRAISRSVEPQEVSAPNEMVAVAAADLFWGTALTAKMMKLVSFRKEDLPEGYFSTAESAAGRILIANLKANEPILHSQLAPLSVTQGGMAVVTQPTKRAMAVRVDDVVGVAGFINPGNRVDILVSLRQAPPKTKTVLQNVLVLATGTQMETQGNGAKPQQMRVVTVEVTPEEAEKLALAVHEGKVSLALRNYANTQPVLTSGATLSTLLSSYQVHPQRERRTAPPAAPPTPPMQVEVIRGGTVQTLTFQTQ